MTWTETVERYLAEGRTVSGGKGEGTAKAEMQKKDALEEKAFNMQVDQLNSLRRAFNQYTVGNLVGFGPDLKAAMQSQFQNQTAGQYNDAASGVKNALLAHGGSGQMPLSGPDIRAIMGLESAKANTLSQGTLGLNIADAQQGITNRFNAGNLLSGNAASLSSPISTFGAGASNALNQYVSASNSGFGAAFMKSLGGSLGAGVGAVATGGLGGGLNSLSNSSAFTPWAGK